MINRGHGGPAFILVLFILLVVIFSWGGHGGCAF